MGFYFQVDWIQHIWFGKIIKKNFWKNIYALHREGYKIIDRDGVDYFEKLSKLEPRNEPHQLTINFDYGETVKEEFEPILKAVYNE